MSTQTPAGMYSALFLQGQVAPLSHPDRLASIATLVGMRPQPIDACRVLEVDCGAGANLLPMADRHPESTFVGIDASEANIAAARELAGGAGLQNVELRRLDAADGEQSLGTFDYILCHGVYSRVGPERRRKLLALCRAHLRPQGVVYASYKSLPGWLMPGLVRMLVRDSAEEADALGHRVARGREVLRFMSHALAKDEPAFATLLKIEIDQALRLPDASLAFEHLLTESEPVYFHQFVDAATSHGLQYVGDAELSATFPAGLGPAVERRLAQVSTDMASLEQHLDLISNRAHHQSLLCHSEVQLAPGRSPDRFEGLRLAANLRTLDPAVDSKSEGTACFVTASGATISSDSPPVKAALLRLAAAWPRAMPFDELASALSAEDRDLLARNLMDAVAQGLVEVRSAADRFVVAVSERPRASDWVRAQAESALPITNRRHEPVSLDELSRNLLRYLDGQRDRAALLQILVEAAARGQLSILKGAVPAGQDVSAASILDQVLDQGLLRLASNALLVA